MSLRFVTLRASSSLLDKTTAELKQSLRFAYKFPESATDLRVAVIMTILAAREARDSGNYRKAEMFEAQAFEMLYFTNDEIHHVALGSITEPTVKIAALERFIMLPKYNTKIQVRSAVAAGKVHKARGKAWKALEKADVLITRIEQMNARNRLP